MALALVVASAAPYADITVPTADKVLVEKAARRLTLLRGGVSLKTYRIVVLRKVPMSLTLAKRTVDIIGRCTSLIRTLVTNRGPRRCGLHPAEIS
jgi:hypothetical protein